MTDESAIALPEPDDRIRPDAEGVPIRAGGKTWLLAHIGLARVADPARNRMFEDMVISSDVGMRDVHELAWIALAANYKLEASETAAVLKAAALEPEGKAELIEAVRSVAIVHEYEEEDRSYSAWVRSSLAANGLDPARIDRRELPHVLRQLVGTGRAMPPAEFTRAAEYAATRKQLLSID